MKVYIAGPYTHPDPVVNVRRAVAVAEMVRDCGHLPFIPHLCHLWHMIEPHEYGYWLDYDIDWLAYMELVIVLPGPSEGVRDELGALQQDVPVLKLKGDEDTPAGDFRWQVVKFLRGMP